MRSARPATRLERVKFRNLVQTGGPEFDEEAVKASPLNGPTRSPTARTTKARCLSVEPKLSDKIKGP